MGPAVHVLLLLSYIIAKGLYFAPNCCAINSKDNLLLFKPIGSLYPPPQYLVSDFYCKTSTFVKYFSNLKGLLVLLGLHYSFLHNPAQTKYFNYIYETIAEL